MNAICACIIKSVYEIKVTFSNGKKYVYWVELPNSQAAKALVLAISRGACVFAAHKLFLAQKYFEGFLERKGVATTRLLRGEAISFIKGRSNECEFITTEAEKETG